MSYPVPRPSRYGTGRKRSTTCEKGNIEDSRKHILWLPEINSLEDIVHCFPLIELHILAYSSLKRHIHKPAVLFRPFRTTFLRIESSYMRYGKHLMPFPEHGILHLRGRPAGRMMAVHHRQAVNIPCQPADGEAKYDDEKQRPVHVGEACTLAAALSMRVALAKRVRHLCHARSVPCISGRSCPAFFHRTAYV